ncbi:MAG TPA: LPS export ABC transporter periplasmic protein LptC, partial [Abditibacteriaceae bacterium]
MSINNSPRCVKFGCTFRHASETRTRAVRVLLAGAFAVGVLAGCRPKSAEDQARETIEQKSAAAKQTAKSTLQEFGEILSKDAALSGHDEKGRFLWSVGAREIRVRDEKTEGGKTTPRTAQLTDARATLYRAGKPESTFRAAKINLVYAPQGVTLALSGGVSMQTSGAMFSGNAIASRGPVKMQTPTLDIDVKARRIRATQGVQLQQAKTVVTARTLAADSGLAVANIGGGIKAVAPDGQLEATQAVWKWGEGRAVATGNIKVSREGTVLTSTRLDADTNAARGTLSGDVRAVSGKGQARAARLNYDWKRGIIEARGGVSLLKDGGT